MNPDLPRGRGRWAGCLKIYNTLRLALAPDPRNPRQVSALLPARGVVFAPGRREHVMASLGYRPVFYPAQLPGLDQSTEKVHLYIDVSPSMSEAVIHLIFGLVLHLNDQIGEPYYQFTTRVRPVTRKELEELELIQGGTSITAVIRHALQEDFPRIVIITDGLFGNIKGGVFEQAKSVGLETYVLLTMDHQITTNLRQLCPQGPWTIWEELEQLEQSGLDTPEGAVTVVEGDGEESESEAAEGGGEGGQGGRSGDADRDGPLRRSPGFKPPELPFWGCDK